MDSSSTPTPTPDPQSSQSDTPTPIFEPSNAPLPIVPLKKRNKAPWIIGILLLLAGIGAAVYFLFFMSQPGQNNNAQTVAESKSPEPKASAAEALIASIKKGMSSSESVTTKPSETSSSGELADGTSVYFLPSYQPGEYEYSVSPAKGYGVAVSTPAANKTDIDDDYDAAIILLDKAGLKPLDGAGYENQDQNYKLYHNKELVCSINLWYDLRGKNYAGVGCADMADYVTSAKAAEPFHQAYVLAANKELKDSMKEFPPYYGKVTLRDGVEGYKNAEVLMNSFAGLYYQTADSKTWKFFKGAQDLVPCSDYNNNDLRNAFAGRPCFDRATSKDSIVQAAL